MKVGMFNKGGGLNINVVFSDRDCL